MTDTIIRRIQSYKEYLIATRRYLHENPETDAHEEATSAFCRSEMIKLGFSVQMVTEYSFIAILDTGKPGKTIALRTDMDALNMDESPRNLSTEKVSYSKFLGKAHTCGHDAHMAMLLTASKVINEIRQDLVGKVVFVFESGEESDGTSTEIAEVLVQLGTDAIWGMHLAAHLSTGCISVDPGPRMSGIFMFEYRISGRGGHSSRPDQCVNPIIAAATIVSSLGNVVSSSLDPCDMGTVVPCILNGGTGRNIIPETCTIAGSGRYFNEKSYLVLEKKISQHVRSIASGFDCISEKTYGDGKGHGAPAVENDAKLSDIALRAIKKIAPEAIVDPQPPWMASEAFGEYCLKIPAIFAFIGIQDYAHGYGAPHHNQHFDFDESVLTLGVKAVTQFTIDFLGGEDSSDSSKKFPSKN